MAKEKLSTAEILARARAEVTKSGESDSAAEPEASETPDVESAASGSPSETEAPKAAAKTPSSTADILAAARAQASGGGADSGGKAATGKTPSSTADILAAARAQATGGGSEPKAASAKTPSSTADILAAARAQAGTGAAPAEKTPVKAAASKTAKPTVPTGEAPSVAEMLQAVRSEKPTGDTSAESPATDLVIPPVPVKPAKKPPVAAKKAATEARRNVILALATSPFVLAWTFFTGTVGAASLALARFMMPNVLVEPPTKFKIGTPGEYPPGTVSTKWKAARGVWIVNTDQYNGSPMIYALSSVCTHLGCTPSWLEGDQKFKCPCHGSGFYINGINFEGPAPRPLERVGIKRSDDGMLEVDKSVKFQEELGQWEDPASFFPLV